MKNNACNYLLMEFNSLIFKKAIVGIVTFVFILFSTALRAQEFKPEIADIGQQEVKTNTQSMDIKPETIDHKVSLDTTFQISVEQISKYYQSTRMILSLKNNSNLRINHSWFQVRLLGKNGEFLYREQPVLFTEINVNQSIRYELIFESIDPEQIGYVVFRPELLELEGKEYPLNESFFRLTNIAAQDIQVVFNTRFQ
ncbi:MAG: hypothetical protein M0Q90_08700 [Bacteroidales bacterium]|nr:hypothetical protein [Bacteroidales bacterium]